MSRTGRIALVTGAVVGAGLLWRLVPSFEGTSAAETLAAFGGALADEQWFPLALPFVYAVATPVFAPVTPMNVAVIFLLGFPAGVVWALVGSLSAALTGWGIGRLLGETRFFDLAGATRSSLLRRIRTDGLIPIVASRLAPLAPFTALNLAAGALRVPLWTFVAGTLLGMAPGLVALGLFRREAAEAIQNPGPVAWASLVGAVVGAGLLLHWLRKRLPPEGEDFAVTRS